ncbi:MAG: hypothetical protein HKN26_16790, partial [Acidimicrobiales bacterium]|nr:hypothetical protein [Acidimicrobiales bacterium]
SWAASMYHIAPNRRSPWRWEVPGAIAAMICWGASSYGFQFFLAFMGETNAIFGVLGAAISLLVWIYLLALGLLIGAEINGILADWYGVGTQRYQPQPVRTAFWWWWHRREQEKEKEQAEEARRAAAAAQAEEEARTTSGETPAERSGETPAERGGDQ